MSSGHVSGRLATGSDNGTECKLIQALPETYGVAWAARDDFGHFQRDKVRCEVNLPAQLFIYFIEAEFIIRF